MKNSKNPHNIAGQSNGLVPKSRKHDANLQKNTTLYFQIGLILCLLGTYGLFEMRFETKKYDGAWNLQSMQDRWDWFFDEVSEVLNVDLTVAKESHQPELV